MDLVFRLHSEVEQVHDTECRLLHDQSDSRAEVATILTNHTVDRTSQSRGIGGQVGVRQVVRLHDVHTGHSEDLTVRVHTSTTPVLVQDLSVLCQSVELGRTQEDHAVIARDILFVQLLGCGEDVSDERVRVGCSRSIGNHRTTRLTRDTGRSASSEDTESQQLLVLGVRQSAAQFLRVRATDIVVVHGLINVGDEGLSQQQVIDGDDDFVRCDTCAVQFGAGSMVRGRSLTDHRKRCRLARRNRALVHIRQNRICFLVGGENFTSEYLEEKSLCVTGLIRLTQTRRNCVCHFLFCE
ncbi:hypothetical protein HJJEPNFP_00032 [Ralstonia phage BOESR1]|nr:hypothetical protein HJJEPNFP_00032 [Ralstonia phage BOESR1]